MQFQTLTHAWFAAETALPRTCFRMSKLKVKGIAVNGLAARALQARAQTVFGQTVSSLDGAPFENLAQRLHPLADQALFFSNSPEFTPLRRPQPSCFA